MGHVVVEGYPAWAKAQRPSLLVVLGNGPAYNPANDTRFFKRVQFFQDTPNVTVYQRNWQVAPFGSTSGTVFDIARATQAKFFGSYQEFPQNWRSNARIITDFSQGNSDVFHLHDTYGWPPDPYPQYWSPSAPFGRVVTDTFAAYPFARDIFLLKQQAKYFVDPEIQFRGQQSLGAINYTYTPYLDATRFRQQDKTFVPPDTYWTFSQPITANILKFFPVYNQATDVTFFRRQAKLFQDPEIQFRGQIITSNILTNLPPAYNPATDIVYRPRPAAIFIPYDDSQWNTGQKPAYNIVLNTPFTPPPFGFLITVLGTGKRVVLSPKRQGESAFVPADFISKLNIGEAILTASVTCSVYSGIDPSPQNMVVGSAGVNGTVVTQLVTAGVIGTVYELLFRVTTTFNQTLELAGYFTVEPDLP